MKAKNGHMEAKIGHNGRWQGAAWPKAFKWWLDDSKVVQPSSLVDGPKNPFLKKKKLAQNR